MSRQDAQPAGPFAPIESLFREAGHRWHEASQHIHRGAEDLGRALSHVAQLPGRTLQRHANGMQIHPLLPGIASVSLSTFGRAQGQPQLERKPQSVFDVAYNTEDIKARLSGVPVYAVVNKKDEFVLIAGDTEKNDDRNMGLFFFKEEDAQSLIDKVQESNPKLGKQSKVTQVGMDAVYQYATAAQDAAKGVIFRFMPDANQVQAAVQLYRDAGVAAEGFTGVPVFQAEGLTVKTGRARYTPLFLSKADLDVALANAEAQRQLAEREGNSAKALRAKAELEAARLELDTAPKEQRKEIQGRVEAAEKRVTKYNERMKEDAQSSVNRSGSGDASSAAATQRPRIEVGCLEEVLVHMEHDERGEWGEVMFVPAGALTQPNVDPAALDASGNKEGRKQKWRGR